MKIRRFAGALLWTAVFMGLVSPGVAKASNAKAQVILEIERLEAKVEHTRWNLNNQDEKKVLKHELGLMYKLYDRIQEYEGELNANPCAGAVLDPGAGPPRSNEGTDAVGLLLQREVQNAPGYARAFNDPKNQYRFAYLIQITDVEVRLLGQEVFVEDQLARGDWGFNNQAEKKELLELKTTIRSALRRLRNSRC